MIKNTIKNFIEKANVIHNNEYDYSIAKYVNNNTKIEIICSEHGIFKKTPLKHINSKQGCPTCSMKKLHNSQRKNIINFISQSNIIHNYKYDYSKIEYKNNRLKIKIPCPEHGEFEQTPTNHLKGKGCKYCGGTSKLDTNLLFLNHFYYLIKKNQFYL